MKRASIMVLAAVVLSVVFVSAQAPQMPAPSPELQKLNYLAGTWKSEGEMKPGPMGPGGKFSSVDKVEWMPGRFFLVLHSTGNMPGMKFLSTSYMGYSPEEKVFTFHEFNSMGQANSSTGTVDGDTWTWLGEDKMQGKVVKGRFIMKVTSPTTYDFKYDASIDGGDYMTVMEGKATKTGGASAKNSGAKTPVKKAAAPAAAAK
jgi:uncharacterized protein DUF1579